MTRQHFEAIAAQIRAILNPEHRLSAACAVASAAAQFNPRFDSARFFTACGV